MILRDVIVASQARSLGRPVVIEPQRAPVAVLPEPLQPTEPDSRRETLLAAVPAPLTFEQVAAWLAVQDGETREACASLLSEELTAIHERARGNGYEAGTQRAKAEAAAAIGQLSKVLTEVTSAADAAFEHERAALTESCADVVGEILAKIAGSALASREAVVGIAMTVLGRVKEDRDATIRVHADDLPILQQEEARLIQLLGRRKLTLVADARVTLGGCIVETSLGSLDGRLDVQLRQMCETLRSAKLAGRESA